MGEILPRLGRVDIEDEAALSETLDGVELMRSFCSGHLAHENAVIDPAMSPAEHLALPGPPLPTIGPVGTGRPSLKTASWRGASRHFEAVVLQ